MFKLTMTSFRGNQVPAVFSQPFQHLANFHMASIPFCVSESRGAREIQLEEPEN